MHGRAAGCGAGRQSACGSCEASLWNCSYSSVSLPACLRACLRFFLFFFFFFSNFFIYKSLPVYERSVFFQLRSKLFGFVHSQTGKEVQRERERERELAGGGEGSRCSILFLFAVLYSCLLLGNLLVETVCLMLVEVEMLDFVLIVSFRHLWRIRICKILQ